jgi:dihydroorotate dehydrogenase
MTSSTSTQKERVNEKYGWVVFLALGLLWLVVGLTPIFNPEEYLDNEIQHVIGMSLSELEASFPEATEMVRFQFGTVGVLKTSWSLLVLSITLWPYRKGEKWAWYTMWLVPAVLVSQGIWYSVYLGDFNEMLRYFPIVTLALVGLFLPYRKFFPK